MYHCTRASRADKMQLSKYVANLVTGRPGGAEEGDDRAIGIL